MKWSLGKMKGIVCTPSYKRPGAVAVLGYLPRIRVYVMESEAAAYRKAYPKADIQTMPDPIQGNVARVRNWILNKHRGEIVCIMDDDVKKICYFEKGDDMEWPPELFVPFLQKYSRLAMEFGTPLWGINILKDRLSYREQLPMTLTNIVLGPFTVHIKPECRYDERVAMVEDYDFAIQTLNKHRKVLRLTKFHYVCQQGGSVTQGKQTGGCAAQRSVQRQMELIGELQKKWGRAIVRIDNLEGSRCDRSKKVRTFDVNPIIHIPIGGV